MKKNIILRFLAVTLILVSAFIASEQAFAAFNISVRPSEGGTDLQFGKVKNYGPYTSKEVMIDITSDIGKQYQIIQTLIEPLNNNQGVSIPPDKFTVYGVNGSNKYGTFSAEQETPVSLSRTIVYTSNPAGSSDSFNLVYVLKNPFGVSSGSYRGRIAFTLEPIGSATQEPVTPILTVFADLDIESGIEIKTPVGLKVVNLNSSHKDTLSSNVLAEIKGGMGNEFKIFQLVPQPLVSIEGKQLPFDAVNFQISDAKYGRGPTQPTPLSRQQDVIYSSGSKGEADNFVITYSLANPDKQKAGRYNTNIKYYIESPATNDLLGDFDLEVEIARVFDLIITPELGGVIEFRNLKPQEMPQQSVVTIEVNSNTGKQYQISQQVASGLVNREGKDIPKSNFTLREESLETKGTLQVASPAEVKIGETVLFLSDKEGASDKFKIIYELTPSLDILAGSYSTRITYSISEI